MSIAPYQPNGAQVAPIVAHSTAQVSAVAQLTEWAHGAQAAHEVAVNLVNTSFCPAHYRGKPFEATAAILAGLEVGLQPMASLQAFNPIQGNAAPKAITLRAIVLSKGHSLDLVESSSTRAVVVGRRNGTGTPQRSEWTIERAQLAGLPKKNPNWTSQPEAMLIARATSEGARLTAADAILGIPYSYEELQDGMVPVQAQAEQVAAPAAAPARRRNVASVLPPAEQAGDVPTHTAAEIAEAVRAETPSSTSAATRIDPKGATRERLQLLFRTTGLGVRGGLGLASEVTGRHVGSEKDLSPEEAMAVIGRLELLPVKAETNEESA